MECEQKIVQPLVTRYDDFEIANNQGKESVLNIPATYDFASSTIQGLDLQYHLNEQGLKRNGFSEKETIAFHLHFIEGME
jgi:hypothetical protein